ncbi:hypothetical protein ABZW30_15410 [Kitasatospora sp. NPDC004669]|uniref:hypothetical protein n=1 Tax=Kitasatospora sp. NPDC004669 TaxID=3154555 RepID=UPI0033BA4FCB
MTTTMNSQPWESGPTRPPLVTRAPLVRFLSLLGGSIGFNLLLSTVPLYARETVGGEHAAGLATGGLMLTTVIGELAE